MTDEEFRAWLADEVSGLRMTPEQMDDLLRQKSLFAQNLGSEDDVRRRDYQRRIVAYVAEQSRIATDIHALLDAAKRDFPKRMIYFEPIGFDLL